MKKVLLFLFLAMCALQATWAYDFSAVAPTGQTLYYNIISGTSNVEVTYPGTSSSNPYSGYTEPSGPLTIPLTVTNNETTYSVTSIGNDAFYQCNSLTSITIPNSVTSIGNYAFYNCSSLTSVTIPNSVTSIGVAAFYFCGAFTSITIPSSVTSIGNSAFASCHSLTSITIPNSVTSIGAQTFSDCYALTSVTIPSSVTSIGRNAFYQCRSLTSITIPNSVTSIGEYAFKSCSSLTSITLPNSVTSIGNNAFFGDRTVIYCGTATGAPWGASNAGCYDVDGDFIYSDNTHTVLVGYAGTGGSVTIPNTVTTIGDYAFKRCSSLTSITIPSSVTSIGSYVFELSSSLTSITIPSSVTTIGDYAFSGISTVAYCGSATGSPWGASNAGCFVIDGDFIYSDNTHTILVGYVGSGGSVTIPNSVTSIESSAFYDCSSLSSITIPNSVTSIGNYAFSCCSSLSSITIPNSVTSIGNKAFSTCSSLNSITIPNSVTTIGYDAFFGLSAVVYCGSAMGSPWGAINAGCYDVEEDFIYSDNTHTILVGYVGEGGNVTIPSSVTTIGDYAFNGCKALTSVTLPNSMTSIGNLAFYNCSSLNSITIPNSVTSIGNYAFSYCRALTSVTIGNSVTSIGSSAFEDCSGLTSVTIGNSVTSIGSSAFALCSKLKTIYNCSNLSIIKGTPTNGGVAFWANRVVVPTKSGAGANALYQIPDTYSFVNEEDDIETNIPRSSIPTNFIYNDNGWKAKEIILTDGQDEFEAPETFIAASATYTRDFTNSNRSTLYLPFSASVPTDLEVYDFSNFENNTLYFTEPTNAIAAYTPYLVGYEISTKDGTTTKCTFSATNVTFPKSETTNYHPVTSNGMTFQGVIERTTMSSNNYGYSNGFFVQSGGSAHVNPFRCYFTYSGDTPSQMPPHTLSVAFGDGPLAIDAVETPTQNNGSIRYSNDVYDLMGRLVRKDAATLDGLPTGIYIWKGRKVLAR